MIPTLIIDDEMRSINVLNRLLKQYCPNIDVIGYTDEAENAISTIKQYQPQLLFLDIRMPFLNGFDILDNFENPSFKVILTTAYDNHTIRAIRYRVFDYLLKPISISELKACINRFENLVEEHIEFPKPLEKEKVIPPKIPIPSKNGYDFIDPAGIIWIEASDSYSVFHLQNKVQVVASYNLKKFEVLLNPQTFLRIHHSHIINIVHLKKFVRTKHPYVVMSDGKELEVSLRKRAILSKVLYI